MYALPSNMWIQVIRDRPSDWNSTVIRSARNPQSFGPSVTISPVLKGPPGSISTRGPSENLLATKSKEMSKAIAAIPIPMTFKSFFIEFSVLKVARVLNY
jgi:hypothetical protein